MPTPAEQQQINDLQKQMYELQGKGAYVPATKLAKQLVDLEKKIYGDVPGRCADLIASVASPALRATFDFSGPDKFRRAAQALNAS